MNTVLNTRIQQKTDTVSSWQVHSSFIPLKGEIVVYQMEDGSDKIKIGDGVSTVAQLDFFGGEQIDVSNYVTASDPGQEVEGVLPDTFGGHTVDEFVLKNEVVNNLNSDSTNVPLSASQGKILGDTVDSLNEEITQVSNTVTQVNNSVSGLSSSILELQSSMSNKLNISGGTLTGKLMAQSNTDYTVGQVRNIYLSTQEPTSSDGQNGDIWLIYEA